MAMAVVDQIQVTDGFTIGLANFAHTTKRKGFVNLQHRAGTRPSPSAKEFTCLHVLKPDNDANLEEIRRAREEELEAMGGDSFFLTDDDLLDNEEEEEADKDGTDMEFPSMSLMGAMNIGGGVASIISEGSGTGGALGGSLLGDGEEEEGDDEEIPVSEPEFLWDGECDDDAYYDD